MERALRGGEVFAPDAAAAGATSEEQARSGTGAMSSDRSAMSVATTITGPVGALGERSEATAESLAEEQEEAGAGARVESAGSEGGQESRVAAGTRGRTHAAAAATGTDADDNGPRPPIGRPPKALLAGAAIAGAILVSVPLLVMALGNDDRRTTPKTDADLAAGAITLEDSAPKGSGGGAPYVMETPASAVPTTPTANDKQPLDPQAEKTARADSPPSQPAPPSAANGPGAKAAAPAPPNIAAGTYPINRMLHQGAGITITLGLIRVDSDGVATAEVVYQNRWPIVQLLTCTSEVQAPGIDTLTSSSSGKTIRATRSYCSDHPGASLILPPSGSVKSYAVFPGIQNQAGPFTLGWQKGTAVAGTVEGIAL
ncbi:hypothetical protein ACFQ7O_01520 [Streptomyces sp. NPDC056485]|uniref:hypothetical protein n=1 Tax=Streptomyces sp. NPDC056485 TaxID=3345834 RepID=UPI0036A81A3C